MPASTPEEVQRLFAEAFDAGLASFYSPSCRELRDSRKPGFRH
jgi:hypothetical protein